jgi:hypothetical protein
MKMFIHCIVKPVYAHQHRDAGKDALINLKAINFINVEYDNCIYAYTKDGERYLVSYYAYREYSDGSTPFGTLCKAINNEWQTYCGILETDEELDKRDVERFKESLSELNEKTST